PWEEDDDPPKELAIYSNWNADSSTPDISGQRYPLETEWMRIVQLRIGPVMIDDVETDRHLSQQARRHLTKMSSRSVIIFPLIAGGKWYGMISFHFAQRHPIDHEDIPHMRGLVDQAAAAIYNQRLLEAEATARQEAERANELRLRFLAMISHELRTPLTSIKGFTTTLLANDVEWDAQTQREFIGIMNQEADKLTDMIDQLLDLSRLEAGSLAINPEKQQLSHIISGALPQLTAIALNHRLVIDVSDQLQPVRADRQRLTQVLTNLVSNAAKYSPAQTNITLTATHAHDYVRVDVSDSGAGIPAQDRLYVFEAFRRGNDERVRRTKGAGLGLAICKGLIEAHGGRIWIQDQDRPGTTISFTLPVAE
ncbi:MAG: ATP-binding protein, partial [Chloroflexi bacterium]|nr:ATP-binding protein [Chloroflexota bacterium]